MAPTPIVLDVAPEYAARAKVTFVAPEAQFTPKEVETRSQRDKLMFRVKLSVPPEASCPSSTGSRPAFAASATSGSTTWPPGPNGLTAPSRGLPPAPAAAAGKPVGAGVAETNRPPAPDRKRRPPDLDEGDAMASPSVGMSTPPERDTAPVASVRGVSQIMGPPARRRSRHRHPRRRHGRLIGPDGVGKSTLMGLIAGSKKIQAGSVNVLGGDMNEPAHRDAACPRIAFMPQGLGKNLYLELSVFENIDFFARLFGVPDAERAGRIRALLDATGLGPFPDRPAGKLSGGMKQKVGLCGALIHDPDLLILDEPTTGVDPLSRQQFWSLIDDVRADRPGMSVLVSTAYMDEAQRFDWTIAMDAGRVIATGTPGQLMERTGAANLEDAFVALFRAPRPAVATPW